MIVVGFVYFDVIAPMFQPPVDPNLDPLQITRNDSQGNPNQDDRVRGSITDPLFAERERPPEHPLDPALDVARAGLDHMRAEVSDYTALMVKQERVGGTLQDEEWIRVKVRHANPDQSPPIPKSFYLKIEKPRAKIGQEVDEQLIPLANGMERKV